MARPCDMAVSADVMWVKHCHEPPITGNGKHTTYENGDDGGMVYGMALFYPHDTPNGTCLIGKII